MWPVLSRPACRTAGLSRGLATARGSGSVGSGSGQRGPAHDERSPGCRFDPLRPQQGAPNVAEPGGPPVASIAGLDPPGSPLRCFVGGEVCVLPGADRLVGEAAVPPVECLVGVVAGPQVQGGVRGRGARGDPGLRVVRLAEAAVRPPFRHRDGDAGAAPFAGVGSGEPAVPPQPGAGRGEPGVPEQRGDGRRENPDTDTLARATRPRSAPGPG